MIPSSENPLGYRFFQDEGFPDHYKGSRLRTDFRPWLRANWIMGTREIGDIERQDALIRICYEDVAPEADVATLIEGIRWFNQCGESDRVSLLKLTKRLYDDLERESLNRRRTGDIRFDYFWDFKEVWASFLGEYRMDLYKVEYLHWWAFDALMDNLGPETSVARRMRLRDPVMKGKSGAEVRAAKLAMIPVDERDEN
jgi:hypothetical protein